MPGQETRTLAILRRMKRRSLSSMPWALFTPHKARPDELTFELLNADQRPIGKIVCTKFNMRIPSIEFTASTPWGEASVRYTKEGPRVFVHDREIALFKSYMLKGKAEFVFPNGTAMHFDKVKGKKNDIVYAGADGRVGFFEEEGALPEGTMGHGIPMTREEIRALPREDRPRSVETGNFVQYRIEIAGKIPVDESDMVKALCVIACFGRLVDEIP